MADTSNFVDPAVVEAAARQAALVVGGDGRGGSGTYIELEDGVIAVLTAKHVVPECLRNTGRIVIGAFAVNLQEPDLIRMDSRQEADAAYLVFKERPAGVTAVPFVEWTKNRIDLDIGAKVFSCGFPGAFREVSERKVNAELAWIADRISEFRGNRVVFGVNEEVKGIPRTFRGLSGAGVFTAEGQFIGVLVEEKRRVTSTRGELHALLAEEFAELYTPFAMPADAPRGPYHAEQRSISMLLHRPDGSGLQAQVGALVEWMWSANEPDHPHGRIGRLLTLEFIIPGIETHYPINVDSPFTWSGDCEEEMLAAAQEEFRFLLLRMRWLVAFGGATIEVNPLT